MRPIIVVGFCLALVACESSEKKAERLRYEESIAVLRVEIAQKAADSVEKAHSKDGVPMTGDQLTSDTVWLRVMDTLRAATARHDLAMRALNAFMSGR